MRSETQYPLSLSSHAGRDTGQRQTEKPDCVISVVRGLFGPAAVVGMEGGWGEPEEGTASTQRVELGSEHPETCDRSSWGTWPGSSRRPPGIVPGGLLRRRQASLPLRSASAAFARGMLLVLRKKYKLSVSYPVLSKYFWSISAK